MYGGKRYHDDQQNGQCDRDKLLSLGQKGFHIVSIQSGVETTMFTWLAKNFNLEG